MSSRTRVPTSVNDLDPFIRTRKKNRRKAHIPDGDKPLCVDCSDAFDVEWKEDSPAFYPDADEWFSLCDRCLDRFSEQ